MNKEYTLSYLYYKRLIVYIWLGALVIYFAHMLFNNGPITKYAQGIVDVINLYCLAKICLRKKRYSRYFSKIIKSIAFIITLSLVYFFLSPKNAIITFDGTDASSFSQLKILFFTLSTLFSAIYFTEKKLLDKHLIQVSFYAFWVFSILTFVSYRTTLYDLTGNEYATNNMGYLILSIFPMSMFLKKTVRYIYWGVCLFIVFIGAKRGAMLLGATLVIVSLWLSMKNVKSYRKIIFLILAFSALYYLFMRFGSYFEYSMNRLIDSQYRDSARDRIFHQILESMWSGSPFRWFIGYGTLGSVSLSENFAHNDWLEFLADYGILGIIPYFIFYVSLVKIYLTYRKEKASEAYIILLSIVYISYKSMFSMCFFSIETSALMLTLGYTITTLNNEESTLIY